MTVHGLATDRRARVKGFESLEMAMGIPRRLVVWRALNRLYTKPSHMDSSIKTSNSIILPTRNRYFSSALLAVGFAASSKHQGIDNDDKVLHADAY